MDFLKRIALPGLLLLAPAGLWLSAQEPAFGGRGGGEKGIGAAITGAKEDPAAFDRGAKLYTTNCAGCHGATGRGGPGAPDLIRSLLVLDDEKGILIAPVLRDGRPDAGMPKPGLSEPQIADLVAWLHVQTYAAGHRSTYAFLDVLTGDKKKGESYFNGAGKCNTCHSPTGDLKGIGARYDGFALQGRWLQPRGGRGGRGGGAAASNKSTVTVTVTPTSGKAISGTLDRVDDFSVSLRDSEGLYHSFTRDGATPKVEIHDPLKMHTDMLSKYTDADIHNVTAYLVTLK
ncbi:MAG: cytochrome c, class [Candidatus Solibacter sp.]|jgi:cytochrome c oxidase cbb3-type subunit 3|nr:cytochrome c, class [Candidatus Solibacter sp.]